MMAASKPTSQLSETANALQVALGRHFGTLTAGWAVALTDIKLTPDARLPESTAAAGLEFDRAPTSFPALAPNPSLYPTVGLVRGPAATDFEGNQPFPA